MAVTAPERPAGRQRSRLKADEKDLMNVTLSDTTTLPDVDTVYATVDGSDEQTETPTPEPETETNEPETEEETEDSPLAKTKAYQKLDYKTKYYKGSGTKKDPYVYLCKEGAEVSASFMNKILGFNTDGSSRKEGGVNKDGKGCYAVLQIREGDSLAGISNP
mgnify:CR=1 FL=1